MPPRQPLVPGTASHCKLGGTTLRAEPLCSASVVADSPGKNGGPACGKRHPSIVLVLTSSSCRQATSHHPSFPQHRRYLRLGCLRPSTTASSRPYSGLHYRRCPGFAWSARCSSAHCRTRLCLGLTGRPPRYSKAQEFRLVRCLDVHVVSSVSPVREQSQGGV
jgi:hypothetical protein